MQHLEQIYKKAEELVDLNLDDAIYLYKHAPIYKLIEIAANLRFKHVPEKKVSWQIDRNVNYTNVCMSKCLFCNFHCSPLEKDKAYSLEIEDYIEKIKVLKELGGNQLLLQGGLHPKYDINYYRTLFKELKKIEPNLKLNALGPPEIAHIARLSKLTYKETLTSLIESGLDTLPGAGAEILSDRVRKILSPAKPNVQQWIDVMKQAHQLGLSTTATMVYGHIESIEEQMQHLITLRDIQKLKPKDSPGFRAFICWPMQTNGTKLELLFKDAKTQIIDGIECKATVYKGQNINLLPKQSPANYIRIIALSRIVLNNIKHIQASWLTLGIDTAQVALHSGADDMGSIMIEENVVSSTGIHNRTEKASIQKAILDAGFEPWLRDQNYNCFTIN